MLRKLIVGMLVVCMVLGLGSLALAQTGKVSVDQWFANHVLEMKNGEEVKFEAPARLTGLSGEVSITDKLGVAGAFVFGNSEEFEKGSDLYGDLSRVNLAVQYEVIPMVKARVGLLTGSYSVSKESKFDLSGFTIGATSAVELSDSIGVFGEFAYAPALKVKAKDVQWESEDSSMMTFVAGGTYSFGDIAVKGGYRYQGLDTRDKITKAEASVSFSGFFIGVGLSF